MELSHPSRKNRDAATVAHPHTLPHPFPCGTHFHFRTRTPSAPAPLPHPHLLPHLMPGARYTALRLMVYGAFSEWAMVAAQESISVQLRKSPWGKSALSRLAGNL